MLFPTMTFVIFFLIVLPLSWMLLPILVSRNNWSHRIAWKSFILVASYIFLGYHQPDLDFGPFSLPLPCVVLAVSIAGNYGFVQLMMRPGWERWKKKILVAGIVCNVGALAYFKYRNFVVEQANDLFGNNIGLPRLSSLIVPIAISFFTFQAISYLVDVYRGTIEKVSFFDLAVYLSFFPHLVAGPIVRASEFIPQLRNPHNPRAVETTRAATLIARGLFKKMVVADLLFTQVTQPAFGAPGKLGTIDAVVAIYAYAAQIYCDFSGYTDIAIGVALLLGFRFPENFNRPYIATSLQDFWQRWHMTLSRWLRDYVYIPLGGNRKSIFGARLIAINLVLTMAIGGLWHGANTTFIVWGLYHGCALAIEKYLRAFNEKHNIEVPAWLRRVVTFHVVTFGWVIFASESMGNVRIMMGRIFSGFDVSPTLVTGIVVVIVLAGLLAQAIPSDFTSRVNTYVSTRPLMFQAAIFGVGLFLLSTLSGNVSAFLYAVF